MTYLKKTKHNRVNVLSMYIVHSAHVLYLIKNVKHFYASVYVLFILYYLYYFYASVYYLFYIIYIISTLVYIILPLNYPRRKLLRFA